MASFIRVRQITDNLDYDTFVRSGIIPDLRKGMTQSSISQRRKYPSFVYDTDSYSFYGIVMEYIVRAFIKVSFGVKSNVAFEGLNDEGMCAVIVYNTSVAIEDIIVNSNALASVLYSGLIPQNRPGISSKGYPIEVLTEKLYVKKTLITCRVLVKKLRESEVKNFIFDFELKHQHILGHPDVLTSTIIFDVKNTLSFIRMSGKTYFQLLAYFAISRRSHPFIKHVGVILPNQQTILVHSMEGWDSSRFLRILSGEERIPKVRPTDTRYISFAGTHIHKKKDIASNLLSHASKGVPLQMFLRSNQSGKTNKNALFKQTVDTQKVIEQKKIRYFTHATYVINLCDNQIDEKDGRLWAIEYLCDDLRFTSSIGGKGVVVHTGSLVDKDEPKTKKKVFTPEEIEEGLQNMEDNVRRVLNYATKECPLLLETSAGEGNDVCKTLDELGLFFQRFTPQEKEKLGVTIDTCHVFSAGRCPLEYLEQWIAYYDTKIGLVHFNDSNTTCGGCVDRHAPIGKGLIGLDILSKVARVCFERGIPMVVE